MQKTNEKNMNHKFKSTDTPAQMAETVRKSRRFGKYKKMKDFAEAIGTTPSNLQNILSGKRYIPARWAPAIGELTGIETDYLLCGKHPIWRWDASTLRSKTPGDDLRLNTFFLENAELSREDRTVLATAVEHLNKQAWPTFNVHLDLNRFDGRMEIDRIATAAKALMERSFDTRLLIESKEDCLYAGIEPEPDLNYPLARMWEEYFDTDPEYIWYLNPISDLLVKTVRDHDGRICGGYIEFEINPRFLIIPNNSRYLPEGNEDDE